MNKKRASRALRLLPMLLTGSLGILLLIIVLTVFFEGSIYRSRYEAVQESLERMAVRGRTNYELLRSAGFSAAESRDQSLELLASASEYGAYLSIMDTAGEMPPLPEKTPDGEAPCTQIPEQGGYGIVSRSEGSFFIGTAPLETEDLLLILCCPAELLVQDYTALRNGMVSISVLTFAVAFLVAFLFSLYPVRGLEEDNRQLSVSGWSIGRKYARQYLYGLAVGQQTVSDELDTILKEYSPFTADRPFGLLLIQPDRKKQFMAFSQKERALYLFGICNILEELVHEWAILQGYPEEGGAYCIALYQLCKEEWQPALSDQIRAAQRQIQKIYGLTVTVLWTRVCKTIYQLPESYDALLRHSHDHLLSGSGSLLMVGTDETAEEPPSLDWQAQYQRQLQRLLGDLQSGQLRDAKAFIELLRTQAQEWWRYRSALALLAGGIEQCILLLISTRKLDADFSFSLDVDELDSVEEIEALITETVQKLDAAVRSSALRRTQLYVQLTDELIEKHYSDSGYGVQQIAEDVGLSGEYLSKLYKQQTGASVLDRLNACRLRHAIRLLEESEIPVGEIFGVCGYSSVNYFYHIFKKAAGVTPKQYRSMTPEQRKQFFSRKEVGQ